MTPAEYVSSPGVVTFTYTLLETYLLGQAHRLADAVPPRGAVPKLEPEAIGAIILSAAAAEAGTNKAVGDAFPPADFMQTHNPVLWLALRHILGARPIQKRLNLLATTRKTSIDWKVEPWISVPDLFRLRNALVHYDAEPVSSSARGVHFRNPELEALAKRLDLWSIHQAGGTWLDVFLNSDGAAWAYRTASGLLKALDRPPWKGSA